MPTAQPATLAAPIVETRQGRVQGVVADGVQTFLGLPYATARRFDAPESAQPWSGVRDATRYGASCLQVRGGTPGRPPPVWVDDPDVALSEDCHVLNVWTPGADPAARRPVMVWVHTGGFGSGSGSAPLFAGDRLALRGDVVTVSFNHRLGVFGFLALPDLLNSANAGMLDIVAALQWIRDNIQAFGGDPGCVTLFGESGGGLKISTLMAMPAAKGLFHRAIIQSGARVRHLGPAKRDIVTARVLERLNGADPRTVPAETLLAAASETSRSLPSAGPGFPHPFTPSVDGHAIPCDPFDAIAPAVSADVPLLMGYNRTEATYFARMGYPANDPAITRAEALDRLTKPMGAAADPILAAFEAEAPGATPFDHYITAFTEYPTGAYARHVAALRAGAGAAPTFMYRFDWSGSVWGQSIGAPHMIELPFVFDAVDRGAMMVGDTRETRALAAKVSAAWCAFARTGSPQTPDLPPWPAYAPAAPQRMLLDTHAQVAPDLAPAPAAAVARALDLPEPQA